MVGTPAGFGNAIARLKWRLHATGMTDEDRRALERVQREIDRLKDENEKLTEEIKKLRRESDDYKKRHPARTGVKNGQAYDVKPEPQPGDDPMMRVKKKPGAQPGHPSHHRALAEPTRVVPVPVEVCPHGVDHILSERVQETRSHTVEDIRIVEMEVTRYDIDRRYCRSCKSLVEAEVPGVLKGARIGLRTMLVVAYLRYDHKIPQESVPEILKQLCGITISSGEVQGILDQLTDAFGPYYTALLTDLRRRDVKGIDETEWRTSGKRGYLWAFVTKWETVYEIATTRAHTVPLRVLGNKAEGTIVTDGFVGYKTLVNATNLTQGRCWAHIIQDAKELAEFFPDEGRSIYAGIQRIYHQAKSYEGRGTQANVAGLKAALDTQLAGPFHHHKVATFARNTRAIHEELFLFVTDPEVPGTNNWSERAIRPAVVGRKVSGGSRSPNGAQTRSRLTTVLRTMRQRGFDYLKFGLPPPQRWDPASAG